MDLKVGQSHRARKELFARGLRRGYLSVDEIDACLPEGCMTPSERWLLYFSFRAAQIDIRGDLGPEPSVEAQNETEVGATVE
jgi:hypothetical protein